MQSSPWPLEQSLESSITSPGTTREVEGDAASDLRDLADRYWEGYGFASVYSLCGTMVAVTGPEDTSYRLILRDVVPPEVDVAEGMFTD